MTRLQARETPGTPVSRRRFLQRGLTAGALAAGLPGSMPFSTAAGSPAEEKASPSQSAQDILSSQNTVLEAEVGRVEKLRLGEKAFLGGEELLGYVPEEFLARRYILGPHSGIRAVCRRAGYVYVVAAPETEQSRRLLRLGFKLLDFPLFELLAGGKGPRVLAYQKRVEVGERLDPGAGVILIFGPEEMGGVPYAQLRSLDPPAFLPDGSEFKTWEVPQSFSKTYYVEQSHPQASDGNPGTRALPFKSINRAAQVLQSGERVIVGAGIYRECVRPARGGSDPEHMISYEAAPGANVVIKGSEVLNAKWVNSPPQDGVWKTRLSPAIFEGYNPFCTANYRQVDQMSYWNLSEVFADSKARLYLQVCGLLFQNGRRLKQVTLYTDLAKNEGAFWVETNGLTIHATPYGDSDPNEAEWEATTREQIFAPEEYYLGYIAVKGFVMENAGNAFPFPQRGAISAMMGHHWIIEGNTLRWANGVGIDIGDQAVPSPPRPEILGYHIVRGNTLEDIGVTGVTGPGPIDSLIENNIFRRNAWQGFEMLAECAAIKTHHNLNVLMRRNLVFDTLYGTGIYVDSSNSNSRICQNVVAFTGSEIPIVEGTGGIYVEAALAPNLVDHNFVWGSTKSNGIFVYTSSKTIIAHNFVGNCATAAIRVIDPPGRKLGDREILGGGNKVFYNILVGNGWNIGVYSPLDASNHNLFGSVRLPNPFHFNSLGKVAFPTYPIGTRNEDMGLAEWRKRFGFDVDSSEVEVAAEFNPESLELTWSVRGAFTEGPPIEGLTQDYWNRPSGQPNTVPGPFGRVARDKTVTNIDPRKPAI